MKPVVWIGSSLREFKGFPEPVRSEMGYALYIAQCGKRHRKTKILKGFKGSGVIEIIDIFEGNAFRTVYTVEFKSAIYVLHAFQKKSKSGIATPQLDKSLIELRLNAAKQIEEN